MFLRYFIKNSCCGNIILLLLRYKNQNITVYGH